jgi:hypothetical protein
MSSKKENENYLHVLKASITNFKNIDYKEVEFGRRSALIIGPNKGGKSSLIQAICSPVNAKMLPPEPIKKGEERGQVLLQIGGMLNGEEVVYNIATYFSPEHQKGRLVIEDEFGGKVPGGVKMLESILGNIGFDIMEFVRLGRTDTGKVSKDGVRRQIEILKSLLDKEDLRKLYALDQEYAKIYEERTDINREVSRREKVIESNKALFTQDDIQTYAKPLDAEEITNQLQAATTHNTNVNRATQAIIDHDEAIADLEKDITKLEEELTIARNERIDKINSKEKVRVWLESNPKKDVDSISAQFRTISEHNEKHRKLTEISTEKEAMEADKSKSEEITGRLTEILNEKKEVFASSSLPIKGLEFDDEKITYKGLPLDDDQIPTSQLIGIGVKIGMAYAPNLRLLIIQDGSLLDKKTLEFILKLCNDHNYQVLIEMVRFEGDEMAIEFIEKKD